MIGELAGTAFLQRAALAGLGLALVAGPMGCFVVWRRMAYFGTSLAHSAVLGIALGLILGISPTFAIAAAAIAMALLLVALQEGAIRLADDTLLGLLAHAGMALGLVALAFLEGVRVDLLGYLFGDVLAVGWHDVGLIWGGGAAMLAGLAWLWRPLLLVSVHPELAAARGVRVLPVRLAFMIMLAVLVALAMKVVGVLLVTSMLIVPAAAARAFAPTPEAMALLSGLIGAVAVLAGLAGSLQWDLPSGPAMVVAATGLFALSHGARRLTRRDGGGG